MTQALSQVLGTQGRMGPRSGPQGSQGQCKYKWSSQRCWYWAFLPCSSHGHEQKGACSRGSAWVSESSSEDMAPEMSVEGFMGMSQARWRG